MSKGQTRLDELRAKMNVPHPVYPKLMVDTRTQAEVGESRKTDMIIPIIRLARTAKKRGRSFSINRDLDGAYRIHGRLDDGKALAQLN
jgi:hypothetical protein